MKTIFLFLLILFYSGVLHASDYYVSSKNGDDANSGALSTPFKTIQKAVDIATAGDIIYVMAGEYRETVIPESSITIKAYQQEIAEIKGTDLISGWSAFKDGIYKAYAPDSVFQVFVNNKLAKIARYPNATSNNMLTVADWSNAKASSFGKATFTGMNVPTGYWNGGYAKMWVGHKWVQQVGRISSSGGNSITCNVSSRPWNTDTSPAYLGNGKGAIYMHLHALDAVDEWHWQNDTLYYMPSPGVDPNTLKIEGRTRYWGIEGTDKSDITIKNLHFVASSVLFMRSNNIVLDGGSVWYPAPFFYFSGGFNRGGNNPDDKWTGKGVYISGNNNTIKNVYVAHSWGDGIGSTGTNSTIQNCLIEDVNWAGTAAAGIAVTGSNHHILDNTVRKASRCLITHRISPNTEILRNNLYNYGLVMKDLGATYTYKSDGKGSSIAYNWVHDNHAKGGSQMGIYLDENSSNFIVHHNVIWNTLIAIQTNMTATNHKIYNNTVWNCRTTIGKYGKPGTSIINQDVRNNLSKKSWNVYTTKSNNLVVSDPKFTDAANFDFTLSNNSPAIDYGKQLAGITDGFLGAAPDAGAYEYGAKWADPGSNVTAPDLPSTSDVPDGSGDINEIEDAYVRDGSFAGNNFGKEEILLVKTSHTTSYSRRSYLKFDLSAYTAKTVKSAVLRLYVKKTNASPVVNVSVSGLSNDSWTETGITWNNQPKATGEVTIGTISVSDIGVHSIDVTDFIQSQLSDTHATFCLKDLEAKDKFVIFYSSESSSNKPELIIKTEDNISLPAAPDSLLATATSASQVNLSWADNSDNETGFEVQRSLNGTSGWAKITTTAANATSFSNTGLSVSTRYYYQVLATNATGNSGYSNIANATTLEAPVAPAAPSNLVATAISETRIDLSWSDNSDNESGFVVKRSLDGTSGWAKIATTAANATSFSNTGLSASTQYYYKVRAKNTTGNSGYSNIANAVTQGNGCTAPAWSSTKTYAVRGIHVSHNGHLWVSRYWTLGDEPGTQNQWGAWKDLGVCGTKSARLSTSTEPEEQERNNEIDVYPNPFSKSVKISFCLSGESNVDLTVHNSSGQRICNLLNGKLKAGMHVVRFDGAGLPAGIYIYKIVMNNRIQTGKIMKK